MEGREEAARTVIVDMWRAGTQSLRDQQRLELRQVEAQAFAAAAKAHLAAQTTELEALRQALERSYYDALEVPPTATEDDIRRALKAKWLRCHPDKVCPELLMTATDLSKILGEVRTTLTDPARRRRYDISINVAQLSSTTTSARPHCERPHFGAAGGGPPGDGGPAADLRGTYGMWITIPLHQRYHCDPWTVDVQESRIQQLRGELNLWESPQPDENGFLILPGWRVQPVRYLGSQLAPAEVGVLFRHQGLRYRWLCHVIGDSAAISLSSSLRLFSSRESANRIITRSRGGSHDWTRGYRFGEAKNPGPPKPSVTPATTKPTQSLTENSTPPVRRWVPRPVPSPTPPPTPKTRSSAPPPDHCSPSPHRPPDQPDAHISCSRPVNSPLPPPATASLRLRRPPPPK